MLTQPVVERVAQRAPLADKTANAAPVEVSVVMPCLNEQDTIGPCIERALQALREQSIAGEVIVADNGSTDGSIAIAQRRGPPQEKLT